MSDSSEEARALVTSGWHLGDMTRRLAVLDKCKCTQHGSRLNALRRSNYPDVSLTDPPMKTFGTERWPVMD